MPNEHAGTRPQPVQTRLSDLQDVHRGETMVVCGCGTSLRSLLQPDRFVTIGVNDVGRAFQPDYLDVLDGAEHLGVDRYRFVESSGARLIFTERPSLLRGRPNVVRFRFAEDTAPQPAGEPDIGVLPMTARRLMTPYIGLCLALYMGATTVGLIGVDLTDHHFFGDTGAHDWASHATSIDARFATISDAFLARGSRVFNLSAASRLRAFPKIALSDFAALPKGAATAPRIRMTRRIVCYATTPRVGVPAILADCINRQTESRARAIWPVDNYATGPSFAGDLRWSETPTMARRELEAADAVILHGGRVAPEHLEILEQKPVLTLAHGEPDGMDLRWVSRGLPGLVLGQHQPGFDAFAGWGIVPSPLPLDSPSFRPERKNPDITIAYTPPAPHDIYSDDHPLHWHGKGYAETMLILDQLATRYPIRIAAVRGRGVSHKAALAMKRRAHIVIDECATGSFHRNSLEGLAAGCVVINAVPPHGAVLGRLRHCSGDPEASPFVHATLDTLETVLAALIELGPELLILLGAQGRAWMTEHWQFPAQWRRFWLPAIQAGITAMEGNR